MPKRNNDTTMKCVVCQTKFLSKSTRKRYCSKACSKVGLKGAIDRQASRRQFAKNLGLKRVSEGYEPKLELSKEAWRIVSDPKLTMRQKYDRLPDKDKRQVILVLESQKRTIESAIDRLVSIPGGR